jgi:hypothetical protein
VRIPSRGLALALLPFSLFFIACQNGQQNKDAVTRGIWDRLSAAGLSTDSMSLDVTQLQFHGNQADADVDVMPKGATHDQAMRIHYTLENRGGKWVVTNRVGMGAHGAAPPASTMPPDHGTMPAPRDLPPAGGRQ